MVSKGLPTTANVELDVERRQVSMPPPLRPRDIARLQAVVAARRQELTQAPPAANTAES
jgi:hypothetical protein